MKYLGPFGYTARICLTPNPDPAFWSFAEIAQVTIGPRSLLTNVPRSCSGAVAYYTQDAAKLAVSELLQDALHRAELDAELAADDAYIYAQPDGTTHRGTLRALHCHAMRNYYNAQWRMAQINSLLLRLDVFDQPIHHRARCISVAPTRRAA